MRAWAYSDALEPMQDWWIVIVDFDHGSLLVELSPIATARSIPAATY